jgi:hypothetical protein
VSYRYSKAISSFSQSFKTHGKDIMSRTSAVESKLKDLENSGATVASSTCVCHLFSLPALIRTAGPMGLAECLSRIGSPRSRMLASVLHPSHPPINDSQGKLKDRLLLIYYLTHLHRIGYQCRRRRYRNHRVALLR